jgi:hypothetical protein
MSKKKRGKCTVAWRLFRSADPLYHWIGLGSFAILLIKVLVLNNISAPLHFMSAVSPVVEGILGSVIASYIFYIFCIHPPIYAEKKTSATFVNFILTRISKNFEQHLARISATLGYHSTSDEFLSAFTGIDPFSRNAPLLVQFSPEQVNADWFEYFQNENVRLQKEIGRLMDSRLLLNTELTYILNTINDCGWFMIIEKMAGIKGQMAVSHNPFVNPDRPAISCCTSMYDLKELMKSLQPVINATGKFIE